MVHVNRLVDEHMKAVIDRFEGDFAVMLLVTRKLRQRFLGSYCLRGQRKEWINVSFQLDLEGTKKQEEKFRGYWRS